MYVVWATVLPNDRERPATTVTALLRDPRVDQFWDPKHGVSIAVKAAGTRGVRGFEEYKEGGGRIPYDLVAVYRPGARWEKGLPPPAYCGDPVTTSIDEVKSALGVSAAGGASSARSRPGR